MTNYNFAVNHWDKLRNDCKNCLHNYRIANADKIHEYNVEYWKKNKEEQTEKHREWRKANRDHVDEYMRKYKKIWEKNQGYLLET